jgi:hypothetical protein
VGPHDATTEVERRPANRWSVKLNLRFSVTDQGVVVDRHGRSLGILIASGWARDLEFGDWRVVETRRLELLTLSLQRRRSAS